MITCIERNVLEIAGLTPPPSTLNILTEESPVSVSYTHLTLPTTSRV